MSVVLACMARSDLGSVRRMVASARGMARSLCLVVAPGDALADPGLDFGLPTRVVEQEWLGFAETRTLAYRYASATDDARWVLMCDADDVFGPASSLPDFARADRLGVDAFEAIVDYRARDLRWRWSRLGHLMRARRDLRWVGTGGTDRHEALIMPPSSGIDKHHHLVIENVYDPRADEADLARRRALETTPVVSFRKDGPTSIPLFRRADDRPAKRAGDRTYEDDVAAFREKSKSLPLDTRAAFYYAQSLKDAGRGKEAFEAFAHRARMLGGIDEETFWAKLWMAKLAHHVGADPIVLFQEARLHSPNRAEPLAALETIHRNAGDHDLAFYFGTRAAACPYPVNHRLFVDVNAYSPTALTKAGIRP